MKTESTSGAAITDSEQVAQLSLATALFMLFMENIIGFVALGFAVPVHLQVHG